MVALSSERNTRLRIGDLRVEPMAAAVKIWGGSLVMRNAAGFPLSGIRRSSKAPNSQSTGPQRRSFGNMSGRS